MDWETAVGRPLAFDRDEAIDAVLDELWRDGYGAVSVKSLSDKLGITRSSFYNALGSLEELFCLALERYLARIPEGAIMDVEPGTPVAPAITDVFRRACGHRASDPERRGCFAANSVAELLPGNGAPSEFVLRLSRAFGDRLETLVQQAVEQGELAPNSDVPGIALSLHNLLMGMNMQSKLGRSRDELWRSTRATLAGLGLYSN